MNGTIDREEIRAFLQEQFEVVEEDGGVSIVSMMHHAHTGPVELLSLKAGHAKWNNAEGMAGLFDAYAARHAKGVVGGGAQQYEIHIMRGGSNRPASVLPFIRVGSTNVMGPSGSLATEPPTEIGLRQQAQRWGEQLTQSTFQMNERLLHSQQVAIDSKDRRNKELEENNRELFIGLKMMIVEFDKMKHDTRMSELAAVRAAEFQRQVMALAPALINMMSGRDIFPSAIAEKSLLDGIAAGTSPDQMRSFASILASQVKDGDKLSALLMDHYNKYHERMSRSAAEEKRLLKSVPGEYESGEADAAGEALRLLTGKKDESSAPKLPGKGEAILKAVEAALTNDTPTDDTPVVEQAPSTKANDTELIESLFAELPQLDMALSFLESTKPELAARLRARLAVMKEEK